MRNYTDRQVVQNAMKAAHKEELLTESDRRRIVVEWNDTKAVYPVDKCIHELFERRVELFAGSVAVSDQNQKLSYAELNSRANQLAHYLRRLGVGPDVLVGVCIDRCVDMVVGLLGVLKAGGAYLPLDPSYARQRLDFLAKDSGIQVVVTQQRLLDVIPDSCITAVCLDRDWKEIGSESEENLNAEVFPENLVYAIYTSGSTGTPKGVQIIHRALVNYITAACDALSMQPGDRFLQFASISFDTAAEEIFVCLLSGATLLLRTDTMLTSVETFLKTCGEWRVTILDPPTAYWHEMTARIVADRLALPQSLRLVYIGGERALPERVREWQDYVDGRVALINGYGPTETTIVAAMYKFPVSTEKDCREVPIGRPVKNLQLYVLDEEMEIVPVGVVGELYIGGEGLSRGYINTPGLTAESFVPDPFSEEGGKRLYRSGDLVRYRADGIIEYVGRRDNQVKIRGFRIEPGEVEAVAREQAGVKDCVVRAVEDEDGEKRLVAYVVGGEGESLKVGEIRSQLKERLPFYMVPAGFVVLDHLPLTPNGKIDHDALPVPDRMRPDIEEPFVAPRSEIEKSVCLIWAEVLRVERVGLYDSFLDLGGDSLRAVQVLSRVREVFRTDLPIFSIFASPTVASLAESIQEAIQSGRRLDLPPIQPVPRHGPLPLSFPQEVVWFLTHLTGGTLAYNTQFAIRFLGRLDVEAINQTFTEIVRRHEIFRTTFGEVDGQPVQIINPAWLVAIPVIDLQPCPEEKRQAEANRIIADECGHIFDTTELPLIRWSLLRLSEHEHVLVQVEHHFVHDGVSLSLLLGEIKAIYTAFSSGKSSPLPELPVQFGDFAVWQRELMQGENLERRLDYWVTKLANAPLLLELPTDRPRPRIQSFRGAVKILEVDNDLSQSLMAFSRREGVTLFTTMFAAFAAMLYRYTKQEDLVVGTSVANRPLREMESLIGMIVNTLVVRTDVSGNPTFRELLRRVRDVLQQTFAHQDLPFERLVQKLRPQRVVSHNPLFQVMFNFHDAEIPDLDFPELTGRLEYQANGSAKFDLDVLVMPNFGQSDGRKGEIGSEKMTMEWEYCTDLFDSATIERMIGHYCRLMGYVASNPDARLSEIPLLPEAERRRTIVEWNDNSCDFPDSRCMHELFEAQVERAPYAIAVDNEGEILNYQELNCRSNQLAHHLRGLGVGPEVRVGICLERSIEMIVAVLAILKAGGAYVPLDPAYPRARLNFIVDDSRISVLITSQPLIHTLPDHGARIVCLDRDTEEIAKESEENLNVEVFPENLVYAIYTSGSTGSPKGVQIVHRALVNYVSAARDAFNMQAGDRFLQFASISFDTAAEEIFVCLLSGATLLLRTDTMLTSVEAFLQTCSEWKVTILDPPTAYWHEMTARIVADGLTLPHSLRLVIIGGERALPERVREWQDYVRGRVELLNSYGPTETTIVAALYNFPASSEKESREVPIGRPVKNLQLYVLDEEMEIVPVGVVGELYIGGEGLSRGYINTPGLTAEAFVPDPFSEEGGKRLYRSGDLVRYRADGIIEYVGRRDNQVKIRGFRIEPGEVEAVAREQAGVKDCVVRAVEDEDGEKRLVAYVVGGEGESLKVGEIRSQLKERLPFYMVPAGFVVLDHLPLTPNGKIDYVALPKGDDLRAESEVAYVAPENSVEQIIANVWSKILQVENVGRHHNFFDLGGNSLALIRVRSRLREALGRDVSIVELVEHTTISALAQHLSNKSAEKSFVEQAEARAGRQRAAMSRQSQIHRHLPKA